MHFEDVTGDLMATALANNTVPFMSKRGAMKEYMPDNSYCYDTYRHAAMMCHRLVTQWGVLKAAKRKLAEHYTENYFGSIFRRKLLTHIAGVIVT